MTIEESDGNLDHLVFDNIEIASTGTVSAGADAKRSPNRTLSESYPR